MRHVLIVTGTCGVGKTSVCWKWSGNRKGAMVECDALRTWIRDPSLRVANSYQEALLARHAANLARDYMEMGLDVAIDNVWTPKGLEYLRRSLGKRGIVRVVWLNCKTAENRRRDRRRSPSDIMGGRVEELQAELEAMDWPAYVKKVDTTRHSLDETMRRIESYFTAGRGRGRQRAGQKTKRVKRVRNRHPGS